MLHCAAAEHPAPLAQLLHVDSQGQLILLKGLEEFREHLGGRLTLTLAGFACRVNPDAWGVAFTWVEFMLSPAPLTALTTKK